MKFKYILLFSLLIGSRLLFSQDHGSEHEDHLHHNHEIGISNGPVLFLNEKTISYGLHLHYTYNVPHSKFGMGLGYERIFDEHGHNILMLTGSYRPIHELAISLSPGMTFEDDIHEGLRFAMHFETAYEFEFHGIHIGPAISFAYDPEDYHLGLGLHIGYSF